RGQLLATLRATMARSPATAPGPVLWVHDHPDRGRDRRLRRRLAGAGGPWLPVRADLDEVWVGPLSGGWAGRATGLDLSRRAGLIHAVLSAPDEALPGLPLGQARVPTHDHVRGRTTAGEWAAGTAETPEEARAVAMLEALERYAATRPRGRCLERASGARL